MYLSIEYFTCPKEQISLYLTYLNYLFFQKQYETTSTFVNSMDPDQLVSLENSVDPDQLIRIHTVFNARCELVIINQNMKYRIVLLLT